MALTSSRPVQWQTIEFSDEHLAEIERTLRQDFGLQGWLYAHDIPNLCLELERLNTTQVWFESRIEAQKIKARLEALEGSVSVLLEFLEGTNKLSQVDVECATLALYELKSPAGLKSSSLTPYEVINPIEALLTRLGSLTSDLSTLQTSLKTALKSLALDVGVAGRSQLMLYTEFVGIMKDLFGQNFQLLALRFSKSPLDKDRKAFLYLLEQFEKYLVPGLRCSTKKQRSVRLTRSIRLLMSDHSVIDGPAVPPQGYNSLSAYIQERFRSLVIQYCPEDLRLLDEPTQPDNLRQTPSEQN